MKVQRFEWKEVGWGAGLLSDQYQDSEKVREAEADRAGVERIAAGLVAEFKEDIEVQEKEAKTA